jgi:hypothetical protein
MTEETAPTPEKSPDQPMPNAPRARRVATPRPKKAVVVKEPEEPVATGQASIPFPSSQKTEVPAEESTQSTNDWPEPEAESASAPVSQSESAKRKRRRRKGKGKSNESQNSAVEVSIVEESQPLVPTEVKTLEVPHEPRPRPQPSHPPQTRPKIDPELLTKMAWKIYLAEVSEEGVALIGDHDAKDLSRRCFRLAEIFIEEQARRR